MPLGRQVVAAIPVKPFDSAKRRLSGVLSTQQRRTLSRRLAEHTATAAAGAGASPLILSADDEVTIWATGLGLDVLLDEGSSLDRAAATAVGWATDRSSPWLVVHADLPLLGPADLTPAVERVAAGGEAIAPSSDGGTALLGSSRASFPFAYGPASFHRHLPRLVNPLVVVCTGLMLDLDEPADLTAARRHRRGRWLDGL
jgi:2-phospho-L-lactate guanylyltransferase